MNATDELTMGLFFIGAITANVYFVLYLFRPWRSTAAGRALMLKTVGNVILLNMILAGLAWPDYPGRPVVRVIGLVVFDLGLLYLLTVLIRTPRHKIWNDRRNARDNGDRPHVEDS